MATSCLATDVRELASSEAFEAFDSLALHYLRISGLDFMKMWNSGAFDGDPDMRPGVMEVASLIPTGLDTNSARQHSR